MLIELGHLASIAALGLALFTIVAAWLGAKWDASFLAVGKRANQLATALLIFGCGTIVYAFVVSDFSVLYVAMNSNVRLPIFFRVAALWGGHEGSLLMWAALVSLFGSLVIQKHWKSDPDFIAPIMGTFGAILAGFLSLVIFLSSPFERLIPAALEGRDLNPLLQDFQMVLHPPMLFIGYTAFAVPFAIAMAVLLTGRGADRWVYLARPWTLIAWISLTIGIALGGHWAYRELGWGGYWAWDPVENASFMPWLVGTALLHSVMVQEQRKTFRIWNIGLAVSAFSLSILGTFLVRSGIISSVHAFASDPSRGIYLLGFFFVTLAVSFGLLIWKAAQLQNRGSGSLGVSREALFLYNNVFFVVGMLTVLLGTLFPLFMDLSIEVKVTVAAPFFNQTFVPLMILNMLLMAVAPVLPWRKFTKERLLEVSAIPAVFGIIGVVGALILGVMKPVALAAVFASFFAGSVVLREWFRVVWVRSRGQASRIGSSIVQTLKSNPRRYGGLLAHLGIAVIAIGFVGSYAYQQETDVVLEQGERTKFGDYELRFLGMNDITGPNWSGKAGHFEIFRDGKLVETLHPEKRNYLRSSMPTTEPRRFWAWIHEFYLTLGDVDEESGAALVKIYINPLVQFVWAGVFLMVFGGFVSLLHRGRFRERT